MKTQHKETNFDNQKLAIIAKNEIIEKIINNIIRTGKYTHLEGIDNQKTRQQEYKYVETIGKLFVFVAKSGYRVTFTVEQIYDSYIAQKRHVRYAEDWARRKERKNVTVMSQ